MSRRSWRTNRKQIEAAVEGGWADRGHDSATLDLRIADPANGRIFMDISIPEETVWAALRNRHRSTLPLATADVSSWLLDEWGYIQQSCVIQLPMKPRPPSTGVRAGNDEERREEFSRWVARVAPGMAQDGWLHADSTYNGHHANVESYTMRFYRFVAPDTPVVCERHPEVEVSVHAR